LTPTLGLAASATSRDAWIWLLLRTHPGGYRQHRCWAL